MENTGMDYQDPRVVAAAGVLRERFTELPDDAKADILKATELKALYAELPTLPADQKAGFGKQLNQLKQELAGLVTAQRDAQASAALPTIDVTAPFDVNIDPALRPKTFNADQGSIHPLMRERQLIIDILGSMGFIAEESRELDDDYHMFTSLNFPADHPARDDYDTFMTVQTDNDGKRLIAPAHTSTMQNRMLRNYAGELEQGRPIAVVVPDRVFRNEDLDARHEHTFHQYEGMYVAKGVHAGMLIATLKTFLEAYYQKSLDVKTQPFYFPFTEPSFEFAMSCPFCESKSEKNSDKRGCSICSYTGWIEILGCGMIHPNVLQMAGVDPAVYSGFAWGGGIERLVMMKYGIEDIRHFMSGKLDFLKQFGGRA